MAEGLGRRLNVSDGSVVGSVRPALTTTEGLRTVPLLGEDFSEWLAAETPRLLRTAYALTGNEYDAWDLLQETVLRVGSRWGRLKEQRPGAYATVVMARLNVDRFRRVKREVLARSVHDAALTAEDLPVEIDQDQFDDGLVEALRQLTPNQRTAVVLRYVSNLETDAIAMHMRCSPGTVRSHLSRGLDRLRKEYSTSASSRSG